MQLKSLFHSLLGVFGLRASSSSQGGKTRDLHESSTSFDMENLRPFLNRVSGMIDSGFGEPEIDALMDAIESMAQDQEKEWSFSIVHAGSATQLLLTAFADDIDVADVAFFTSKALADAIDSEMDTFFEELGI